MDHSVWSYIHRPACTQPYTSMTPTSNGVITFIYFFQHSWQLSLPPRFSEAWWSEDQKPFLVSSVDVTDIPHQPALRPPPSSLLVVLDVAIPALAWASCWSIEWLLLAAYSATECSTLLMELTLLNPIGSHCRVSYLYFQPKAHIQTHPFKNSYTKFHPA